MSENTVKFGLVFFLWWGWTKLTEPGEKLKSKKKSFTFSSHVIVFMVMEISCQRWKFSTLPPQPTQPAPLIWKDVASLFSCRVTQQWGVIRFCHSHAAKAWAHNGEIVLEKSGSWNWFGCWKDSCRAEYNKCVDYSCCTSYVCYHLKMKGPWTLVCWTYSDVCLHNFTLLQHWFIYS